MMDIIQTHINEVIYNFRSWELSRYTQKLLPARGEKKITSNRKQAILHIIYR